MDFLRKWILEHLKQKKTIQEEFQVFPNPASEVLYIKGLQDSSYEVYNITGIKVVGENRSNKIELIDLPNGTYIIKTIDGRLIKFLKIK